MKLSQKTIYLTSILTVFPIIVLIAGLVWYHTGTDKAKLKHNNLALAEMSANYFDAQLEKTGILLSALETMPAINNHNAKESNDLLKTVFPKYPFLQAIFVADKNGNVFADTNASKFQINIGKQQFFQNTMSSGKLFISAKTYSLRSKKPIVRVSYPIRNSKGEITGVLGAIICLKTLQQNLESIAVPNETNIYLIDRNKSLLASVCSTKTPHSNLNKLKIDKYFFKGMRGTSETYNPYTKEKEILSFVPLKNTNWGIIVAEPSDHLTAALKKDIIYNAPLDLLLIAPFITYIFLTNRRLRLQQKELQEVNSHLEHLSFTDNLTGLHNNRYFYKEIEKELERCKRFELPMALLILDIDDFKYYNDNNGHLKGDQALKEFAQIIKKAVRNIDTVARYGGEEFVIMLVEVELEEALTVAERIRHSIYSHNFEAGETQPRGLLSASIGISVFPKHADKPTTLLEMADKALYQAKGRKNAICVANIDTTQLSLEIE